MKRVFSILMPLIMTCGAIAEQQQLTYEVVTNPELLFRYLNEPQKPLNTYGVDGTGVDVKMWGDTVGDYMLWDFSEDALAFVGSNITIDDDSLLKLGSGADATFQFDGTNLELFAAAADTPFAIGGTTNGFDLTYYFETAGTIAADYDADTLTFSDGMSLVFGTNSDASIMYDETTDDNLEILAASVGMSITTNDFLVTLDNTAADQFKVDATGAIAGYAINFETTDGGILLNADGAANGDIGLDAADDLSLVGADDVTLNGGSAGSIINIGTNTHGNVIHIGDNDTTADTITIGSAKDTVTINRVGQQYVQSIAYAKLGASGAGWAIGAADSVSLATLPQSQTAENIVVPITIPLKVGWTITAFSVNGQIDSAGETVTLDADLRKHTEATDGYADASIGAITQISKTADYKVADSKTGLAEVVAADESYYILITGTTGSTTDIEIASITVTVTEI